MESPLIAAIASNCAAAINARAKRAIRCNCAAAAIVPVPMASAARRGPCRAGAIHPRRRRSGALATVHARC